VPIVLTCLSVKRQLNQKNSTMAQSKNTDDGIGNTISKTFSRTTAVRILVNATPEIIWALLTSAADFPRWNSTIKSIEGTIAPGKKIRLKTTMDEKRTFTLKVATIEPEKLMVWASGQAPFFQGLRTYTIEKRSSGVSLFTMTETLSGLMFPLAAKQIPDFKASFEQYAADLKKEAELIANIKN
jgi:hypothetical protein